MPPSAPSSLREQLPEEDTRTEQPPLQDAYLWFASAVNRWLDIACYKAMHRIKRAIELDQATQVRVDAGRRWRGGVKGDGVMWGGRRWCEGVVR